MPHALCLFALFPLTHKLLHFQRDYANTHKVRVHLIVKYLNKFPQPLLDDLVSGRWFPIVGAGLSRNAVLPYQRTVPLWSELGKSLARYMKDYESVNPIDAISAYEYEFGRPKLIELLFDLLFITDAQPSNAHRSFCALPFDIVCTTNLDFLLERQYEFTPRTYTPLIDEAQLSVNLNSNSIALLKLHGDLNNPNRLVVTEEDYDRFLERYPVIATYLANLLITRTAVFIGYSLDDPDFRQMWQVVGERLGKSRRLAYALCVGARPADVARFERRGVKVINLARNKGKYEEILSKAFNELRIYWQESIVSESKVKEEEALRELSLPGYSASRLCFFSIPLSAQPFYRERVFPLVREVGLVPVTADDIISPGENIVAKIDALINRSFLIVVDASSEFTLAQTGLTLRNFQSNKVRVIIEKGAPIPIDIQHIDILRRPNFASIDFRQFLNTMMMWFQESAIEINPKLSEEPRRLLLAQEYRAAVISAITYFELTLRQKFELEANIGRRFLSVRNILETADIKEFLGDSKVRQVSLWLKVRNSIVHNHAPVSLRKAREIVYGVEEIINELHHKY